MNWSRRELLGGSLGLLAGGTSRVVAQTPPRGLARHVVMVSLDGFAAENLDRTNLPLPNLRRLAAEGTRVDRMSVVTPSVTWPNHTTLVTGTTPARHWVLANGLLERATGQPPVVINPRRSKQELCRIPTLYDVAHQAGLRTAEINWPVTRGAPTLDWSLPDHPDPLKYATEGLVQELVAAKILPSEQDADFSQLGGPGRDYAWTQAACYLARRYRPHVLLLHLLNTDSTQHAHGPGTPEATTALALADRLVGDLISAVQETSMRESTAFLVVADHGFQKTTRQIHPNVRFRKAGLIVPGPDGKPVYHAQAISEGGVALVYVPEGRVQPDWMEKTAAALANLPGVDRVLTSRDFVDLGLPQQNRCPHAPDFVLTARDEHAFSSAVDGESEVTTLTRPTGTHGYVHTDPRMDALCILSGAGVRKGGRVKQVRNIDVAPTAAALLGLTLPDAEGKPISGALLGA